MVDRQHRPGGHTGSGGVASFQDDNLMRRQRVKKLAMDAIDLTKDPYFLKNHLGTFQCRLCLTLHSNQGNYLAHTQAKKHQANLARRIARQQRDNAINTISKKQQKKVINYNGYCVGKPNYRLQKIRNSDKTKSIKIEVDYPQIKQDYVPQFKIINSYEQRYEAADQKFMYLLIAGPPYSTLGFRIPNLEIIRKQGGRLDWYDSQKRLYTVFITFK